MYVSMQILQRPLLARDPTVWYYPPMTMLEQLKTLSRPEALAAMETLWTHLLELGEEPASPEWHGDELARREQLVEKGEAKFADWDEAKKRLFGRTQ